MQEITRINTCSPTHVSLKNLDLIIIISYIYFHTQQTQAPANRNARSKHLRFLRYVYATHATQVIAFEWKPGLRCIHAGPSIADTTMRRECKWTARCNSTAVERGCSFRLPPQICRLHSEEPQLCFYILWPCDLCLLTSKYGSRVTRLMGFHPANFGLSVLELGRGKRDTDGQTDIRTDGRTPEPILLCPFPMGQGHNKTWST